MVGQGYCQNANVNRVCVETSWTSDPQILLALNPNWKRLSGVGH